MIIKKFIIIGIFNAVTVIYLINQVDRFINRKTAVLTMVFTVYSTGYFIASTAFLPSSFGMGFITLAFAKSLEKTSYFNIAFIIASVTIAGVVGWPFCLAYGGIYVVQGICTNFRFLTLKRFLFMVVFSIICVLLTGIPMVFN